MAEWRWWRGWNNEELRLRLEQLAQRSVNFPANGPEGPTGAGWRRYYSEAVVATEEPGPILGEKFEKLWQAVTHYSFSDPGIVCGHFDPSTPLAGRNILLEIKVLGLRYLCGARVDATRETPLNAAGSRGFRYDTLSGHLEQGSEWFVLTKDSATGHIRFRIQASWKPGHFPNWWSRLGFLILGQRYQLAWHRLAYLRLREIAGGDASALSPLPRGRNLYHSGAELDDPNLWVLKLPSPPATELLVTNEKGTP